MQHTLPRSAKLTYQWRWFWLVTGVLTTLLFLWLLMSDLVMKKLSDWRLFVEVEQVIGFIPVVDHGLEGVAGVYPGNSAIYFWARIVALVLWVGLQVVFLWPERDWKQAQVRRQRLPRLCNLVAGFIAALVTTALVTTVIEMVSNQWVQLGKYRYDVLGGLFKFNHQALPTLSLLLAAWVGWTWHLGRCGRVMRQREAGAVGESGGADESSGAGERELRYRDQFMQRLVITYSVFVAAGLTLFVAGLYHSRAVGFNYYPPYWHRGSYTGMALSLIALLWTVGPGLVLLFQSQQHFRRRSGECLHCGYSLRGSFEAGRLEGENKACPECGEKVGYAIAEVMGVGLGDEGAKGLRD